MGKILFWISFIASIIILLVGLIMKFNKITSGSVTFSKFRGVGYGELNGTSTIILGIILSLFSFWFYRMYKKERLDRQKRLKEEKNENIKFIIKQSKNNMQMFLFNRKEFYKKYKIDK